MLLSAFSLLFLVTSPSAQAALSVRQSGPPACAGSCLVQAIANAGSCAPSDTACLCTSQSVIETISTCLSTACNEADLATSRQFLYGYCATGGVTIASLLPGSPGSSTAAESSFEASASGTSSSAAMTEPSSIPSSSNSSTEAARTTSTAAASSTIAAASMVSPTSSFAQSTSASSSSALATTTAAANGAIHKDVPRYVIGFCIVAIGMMGVAA